MSYENGDASGDDLLLGDLLGCLGLIAGLVA